jgi:hypothetical protein
MLLQIFQAAVSQWVMKVIQYFTIQLISGSSRFTPCEGSPFFFPLPQNYITKNSAGLSPSDLPVSKNSQVITTQTLTIIPSLVSQQESWRNGK